MQTATVEKSCEFFEVEQAPPYKNYNRDSNLRKIHPQLTRKQFS
jgi:hypothetical protein